MSAGIEPRTSLSETYFTTTRLKKVVTLGSFYVRGRCNQTDEKNLLLSVDTKLTFAPILGMVDDDDGGSGEFQQTIKELAE